MDYLTPIMNYIKEMNSMKNIVRIAMEEGAMGIGSSLIYAPGDYADTDELVELSKIASSYGGSYISHMRNEDFRVLEAVDELLEIAERANIPAQIYHLKTSRKPNWHLLDSVIKSSKKPVTVMSIGGKGGGGTELTEYGKSLILVFEEMNKQCWKFLDVQLDKIKSL